MQEIKLPNLSRVRGERLKLAYKEAQEEAVTEFDHLKFKVLFIAGLMLYWGEGDKTDNNLVRLTNTDAKLVLIFINFLKGICHVPADSIRINLLIYPDLDEIECMNYWSLQIGLPLTNFAKCTAIKGKHPYKRLEYGVCIVYVSSKFLKKKFLSWLNLLPDTLINKDACENI